MDSSTEIPSKRWQIRVLNGPAQGVSRLLDGRLSIGRAVSSDIYLGASDISRQHAQIIEDERGRHILVDLASSNGTYVDGQGIERHVLEPNTLFSIVDVDLAYEEAREPARSPAPAPTPVPDTRTLRGTAQLRRYHSPTRDYPSPDQLAAQEQAQLDAPPPSTAGTTDPQGRPLRFLDFEGDEYEGPLIDDIIEYRSLRAQHLRGGFAEPSLCLRFETLENRLRQPPSPDPRISQRAFCRFDCWLDVRLRLADGAEHICKLRDLGVDGAQLVFEGSLSPDSIVWLTIEMLDGDRSRTVVLAARVAWTDEQFVGLAFAGAPRRVQGRYAEQPGPRNRDRFDAITRPCHLRLSTGSNET